MSRPTCRTCGSAQAAEAEFVASFSHRLRTPLTAIVGWAHLLRGGKLSLADTSRAIETIIRNADSQARVIDELLEPSVDPPTEEPSTTPTSSSVAEAPTGRGPRTEGKTLHWNEPVQTAETGQVAASVAASRNAGKAGRM